MAKSRVGFGRIIAKSEKDREFLLPFKRRGSGVITQKTWWTPKPCYDQGATSECVAYSAVRYLTTNPIRNKPLNFREFYNECKKNDEWPGESYDGTSVRAAFKVFKERGYVSEYRWAFDFEPVIAHLLMVGPVVMGTYWTPTMSNVRDDGYVEVGHIKEEDDGHAWLLIGANRKRRNYDGTVGACRGINSWGDGWGIKGRFWITFKDLDRLIKADGEACVATEVLLANLRAATTTALA